MELSQQQLQEIQRIEEHFKTDQEGATLQTAWLMMKGAFTLLSRQHGKETAKDFMRTMIDKLEAFPEKTTMRFSLND